MEEKERIIQLRKELHAHNYRYYVQNSPTISDREFDFLMKELQQLEERHPDMDDPNSPTRRVGSDLNQEFRQVKHRYPMLSLTNTYNEQDVRDWFESVERGLAGEPFEVCCELKYDGLSISLIYENGQFVQAVTRGDGVKYEATFSCHGNRSNDSTQSAKRPKNRSSPTHATLQAER